MMIMMIMMVMMVMMVWWTSLPCWEYWSQLSFPEIGDNWVEYTDHAPHCFFTLLWLRISVAAAPGTTTLWRFCPKGGIT